MTRLACAAALLVAGAAVACVPAAFIPFTAKGKSGRGLTLEVGPRDSTLKEGGKPVWTVPFNAYEVLFAPDDAWVAFSPGLRAETVTLVATKAGAPPIVVDLVARLSKDEQAFLTDTSCGRMWFSGWTATAKGLEVVVTQNGQARPTEADRGGIAFLIAIDGTVTRLTAALTIDLPKLAESWKGPPSTAREGVLSDLYRLASTETGAAQAAKLGPFLRRVFAAPDARPGELDLAGRLVGKLSAAEQQEVGALALTRPGSETGLVYELTDEATRAAFAAKIFADTARSGRARSTALRVATREGAAPYGALLKAGLTDADLQVREAAADNAARGACSPALLNDVLAVLRQEAEHPSTGKDAFAHVRLVENYQRTAWGCLRDSKTAEHHAAVATAVAQGLRFVPDQYSSPDLYLALALWAEPNQPATVPGLLDLADQACAAQKYNHGVEMRPRVTQWRLLRAIKAKDKKAAKQLLGTLDAKGRERLPIINVADVGTRVQFEGRQESVAELVARIKPVVAGMK